MSKYGNISRHNALENNVKNILYKSISLHNINIAKISRTDELCMYN